VSCVHETQDNQLETGAWKVRVYTSSVTQGEHVAMIKGDISAPGPVLVRMQAIDPIQILPGGTTARLMADAMRIIGQEGRGVMVVLHDWRSASLMDFVKGRRTGSHAERMLRDYGIGAQILNDLGVHDMILLSNTDRQIIGLEGYGLNVVGRRSIDQVT
jgi:3,4-dihydroxy 2-butanone 4-phosphate synthase/GTP cyclohydrolase II